jgi:hypothetical protein
MRPPDRARTLTTTDADERLRIGPRPQDLQHVSASSAHRFPQSPTRKEHLMDIEPALKSAMNLDGALGAALVDYDSGMALGTLGGGRYLDLEVAAAGNTEVVRAKIRTMASLDITDDVEDILITLGQQYHLIRMLPAARTSTLFMYLALDRSRANLALARHELRQIEKALTI